MAVVKEVKAGFDTARIVRNGFEDIVIVFDEFGGFSLTVPGVEIEHKGTSRHVQVFEKNKD